ncbi:hypothetical protein Ancab_036939 [Ancistrocladus abbreviatus]
MSRPQEPHRHSFPFGNPFRMMLPKGSHLSPKLLALLNKFEETLAGRLRKLRTTDKESILTLPWMTLSLQLLLDTHKDIKSLITDLELSLCDWDDKWIDVYLDNSVKLLDICIAFSSELSRLSQGQLLLQCGLCNLERRSSGELMKARSSLNSWGQHIGSTNPRVENCCSIIDKLVGLLNLPKVKNSAKGRVLTRAMYGVKVQTLFVCSVFTTAFTGSAKKLIDLRVPEAYLWAEAFNDLQTFVNGEIRSLATCGKNILVKELQAVDACVKDLYLMLDDGIESVEEEALKCSIAELAKGAERLSEGLDLLGKEVDGFFQIVLTGRDALLGNLRIESNFSCSSQERKVEEQMVR